MLTDANPLPLCFFHSLFKLDSMIEKNLSNKTQKFFNFQGCAKILLRVPPSPPLLTALSDDSHFINFGAIQSLGDG